MKFSLGTPGNPSKCAKYLRRVIENEHFVRELRENFTEPVFYARSLKCGGEKTELVAWVGLVWILLSCGFDEICALCRILCTS